MKKIIVTSIFAMLMVSTAMAEDKMKLCETYAKFGQNVMQAHQAGIPLNDILQIIYATPSGDKTLLADIATDAYSKPRYSVQENKDNAVSEYRDMVHVACLRAIR